MILNQEHKSQLSTLIPQLMIMAIDRVLAMGDNSYTKFEFLRYQVRKWGEEGVLEPEATSILASLEHLCSGIFSAIAISRGRANLDENQRANFNHELKRIKATLILATIPNYSVLTLMELAGNYIADNFTFFANKIHTKDLQEFVKNIRTKKQPALLKNKTKSVELERKIANCLPTHLNAFFNALQAPGFLSRLNDILLFGACIAGNIEVATQLIVSNAHLNEIVAYSDFGAPLHVASQYGHIPLIELLLTKGAQVNLQDEDQNTALHRAVEFWQYDVIDVLTNAPGIDLNIMNVSYKTPLGVAVEEQNELSVIRLLKSPHQVTQAQGIVTLNWLARNNAWQLLCFLYKDKNLIPREVISSEGGGLTALEEAIFNSNIVMVNYITDLPGFHYAEAKSGGKALLEYAIQQRVDNKIVTLLAQKSLPEFMPEKVDLVEYAIVTQNFELLRVIETNASQLLPNTYDKSVDDRVHYLAIIKALLAQSSEYEKCWNEESTLKDTFLALVKNFVSKYDGILQMPSSIATKQETIDRDAAIDMLIEAFPNDPKYAHLRNAREQSLQQKKSKAPQLVEWEAKAQQLAQLDSPKLITQLVEWQPSIKEKISYAQSPEMYRDFSKLIQFVVFKYKFIETLSEMDFATKELAKIASPADRMRAVEVRVSANVKSMHELSLADNNNNNNNNSFYDDNNNNNNNFRGMKF
ncbi:MAG: ankyrin repeat domain-containing protein [Gammaproteobacteria bacterium]|nr:ankyrin repeat domain-containing protein [Gammaproteobacteria bacterium]